MEQTEIILDKAMLEELLSRMPDGDRDPDTGVTVKENVRFMVSMMMKLREEVSRANDDAEVQKVAVEHFMSLRGRDAEVAVNIVVEAFLQRLNESMSKFVKLMGMAGRMK